MCATGSEALRNAAYAVACGAYDLVMAIGVEKLKDSGYSGLVSGQPPSDGTAPSMTAPANFSLLAPAYAKKYGVDEDTLKQVLTRIAWKNHRNGAKNPKAQFRKEVPMERIAASPKVAGMLGIFDCSGVSDGSAAAILCRAEDAHRYTDHPIFIKALSFVAGPAEGYFSEDYDFTTFPEVCVSVEDAYKQAGVTNPREEISMAEVHDCFTPTELVLMEDMGFSPRGQAWKDVFDGRFDGDGPQPINPDGGLKSFGHPIGASGLRMMYEMWLQLRGEAGERQIPEPQVQLLQLPPQADPLQQPTIPAVRAEAGGVECRGKLQASGAKRGGRCQAFLQGRGPATGVAFPLPLRAPIRIQHEGRTASDLGVQGRVIRIGAHHRRPNPIAFEPWP